MMDSIDNWDLMPPIDYSTGDPNYSLDPTYTSPGQADQNIASDQVAAGGGYGMGGLQSGSSSGSGLDVSAILKLLGLTGKDGNINSGGLLTLLSALGLGAGGLMNRNATNNATNLMSGSIDKANNAITGLLGAQQQAYAPYQQAGASALGKLQGMNYQPLAGKFSPVQGASSYVPTSAGVPQGRTLNQMYRG
jgi:hypothetical protein